MSKNMVLNIGEGKGIHIEFPDFSGAGGQLTVMENTNAVEKNNTDGITDNADIIQGEMKHCYFEVKDVKLGKETTFEDGILTIRESLIEEAYADIDIVKKLEVDILKPGHMDIYTNTIMDLWPIATKKEGTIGNGVTYVMDGVIMMLTGTDENGIQVSDANSSDGILSDRMFFGRPGAADENDIIIRVDATIEGGRAKERPGPLGAHRASDHIADEIRQVLKKKEQSEAAYEKTIKEVRRSGRPKVVLVKEIMGQGAMHDNLILPTEPAGVLGGIPNVDLGNMPVLLSSNEVFDGGIHALTCITPDTKETTRAYFREPFLKRMVEDEELDVMGVIFIGSPQANTNKAYVSARLGKWVQAMGAEGAIITTEGYGNNHVDFASHIYNMGAVGVKVVGVSFCGVQGALVVGNKYMDAMVDLACENGNGIATDRIGENSISDEAALSAVAMLKNKLMGEPIEPADKKWNFNVHDLNLELAKESHHEKD